MRETLCAVGDVARRMSPDTFSIRVTFASGIEGVRGAPILVGGAPVVFGAPANPYRLLRVGTGSL